MDEQGLKKAKNWILDLLFPPKCPFCGTILRKPEELLCAACQRELPWLTGKEAERTVDFAKVCLSPMAYREKVPEAVRRYKFRGVRAYAEPFGVLMAQCVRDRGLEGLDGVTWAPLSKKRLRARGYDQAKLLAAQVAKDLELPLLPTLDKLRHTRPQSGIEQDAARRANALGAYGRKEGLSLEGKRLLLVDDVVTSGSTLSECARLLCQGGAEVCCLTLAQARTGREKQTISG